jgi:hypothetical protein
MAIHGKNRKKQENHGMTGSPIYKTWSSMKQRCHKQENYINRGIGIQPEWEQSYDVFLCYLKSTIGLKPGIGYSLDRCDNDLGYVVGNIRWSTLKENNRNKSNTRYLTYEGVVRSVSAWAEVLDVDADTLYTRLNKGWSVEDTLTKPVRRQQAKYQHSK